MLTNQRRLPTFEIPNTQAARGDENNPDGTRKPTTSLDWMGPGWYRFTGQAGSQMATKNDVPSKYLCGTAAPGYINADNHPNMEIGMSVDAEVCFFWTSPCWRKASVTVVNCGDFYVYKLPKAADYGSAYCGVSKGQTDDKCLNVGCNDLWAGDENWEGVCVDLYHNRWSKIEDTYDVSVDAKKVAEEMGYANKTLCKPSKSAYKDPNRDCCRCFRKPKTQTPSPPTPPPPCSDNGCTAQGGECVNLINADLTSSTKGPRSKVDLDQRLADGLCHMPTERHCCDCYLRKNNTTMSTTTSSPLSTTN